ncbi:MAG: alpha/beta fold hydrolase, partial [Bryobacteraceae bacterium]
LMARRIERLFLAGPAGRLEAMLEEPEEMTLIEAALVCHPHPQHGGTMHNKVVYRIARGLRKSGCAVLRFNYRGVNLSQGSYDGGVGETEDARAGLNELRQRYPELPLAIAGFSFGARIAVRLASEETAPRRVIAAGFPTKVAERSFVNQVRISKYFVQSTRDEFGPVAEFADFFQSVPEPKHLEWIDAEDHFFGGALDAFESAIARIGQERPPDRPARLA